PFTTPPPPSSTLFPYTSLFRSHFIEQPALERARDRVVDRPCALAAAEHEQRGTGREEPELHQCGVATPRLGHADRVAEREHGRARTDAQALARFGKSQMDLPRAPREPARRQAGKCVLLLEHGGEPALL